MGRLGIFTIVVLLGTWVGLSWSPTSECDVADAPGSALAHQAIGLLQYVWGDYPQAVSTAGDVLDADEFGEQQEMLERVGALLRQAARLRGSAAADTFLLEDCALLQHQVWHAEAPERVQESITELRRSIVQVHGLRLAPENLPDVVAGARLYSEACAVCHAVDGRSDTDVAAHLTPAPTDLQAERLRNTLSPYQVYNVVSFGVAGTSMPSFPSLTEQERWAIAFHVVALRHQETLQEPDACDGTVRAALPGLTLAELAQSSDAELRLRLQRIGVQPQDLTLALARLRTRVAVP